MLNVLIVPSSPSSSPIIDSDANDASPPPFPRPFPLSDDIPQASYSRHPYSASTIPPIQYDSSSSEIPTSNGEAEFSSSQLFVQFTPPERPPVSIQSRIPIPSRPSGSHPRSPRESRTRQQRLVPDGWIHDSLGVPPRLRTRSTGPAISRPKLDLRGERLTSSENGETSRGPRLRVLSLPRHAHRPPSNSDSSEQQSPLTPSAFNDIPPMPIFRRRGPPRHRQQDSGLTQQSTTSSSLYPRSTSSGTESFPSPPSLPSRDIEVLIQTADPLDLDDDNPHIQELSEMDADDVSYRLRLLMKNNYYLPPAHSKPYSDIPINADTLKKAPSKPASPTFLDIFKVGKRTKGSSPDTQKPNRAPVSTVPILRTTSDTSVVSGLGSTPPRPSPHHGQTHVHGAVNGTPQSRQEKKGRVVVVRERMDDIIVVAKQVERDLKTREAERKRGESEQEQSVREDDQSLMIDPTDSVDLPPLGAGLSFGPQSSALNGLGIEASLGAAVLADHLPPASPWSEDTEEEAWRKAILQEAVVHSLNNSPAVTPSTRSPAIGPRPFRSVEFPSSPSPLSVSDPSSSSAQPGAQMATVPSVPTQIQVEAPPAASSAPAPRRKRELGQRILSHMISEEDLARAISMSPPPHASSLQKQPSLGRRKTNLSVETKRPSTTAGTSGTTSVTAKASSRMLRVSSGSLTIPSRAETPVAPTHPLAPPPRRQPMTPVTSDSHSELLGQFVDLDKDKDGRGSVRSGHIAQQQQQQGQSTTLQTHTPARLPDLHEEHVGLSGAFGALTPPPVSASASQGTSSTVITPLSNQFRDVSPAPGRMASVSVSSGSRYSEDDEDDAAFHTPMEPHSSAYDISRPSLTVSITSSDYSEPSPTASAFRDALDNPNTSSSRMSLSATAAYLDGSPRLSAFASAQTSRVSSMVGGAGGGGGVETVRDYRFSTMSPPPRTSSSLAHTILPPPPLRMGVYATPRVRSRSRSGLAVREREGVREGGGVGSGSGSEGRGRTAGRSEDVHSERTPTPHASEPNTPTGTSRLRPPSPLVLGEPGSRNGTLPSNSYPPSPISFFDAVEMQSRDEESESDEEEEEQHQGHSHGHGHGHGHGHDEHDHEDTTAVNVIDNRHSESSYIGFGAGGGAKFGSGSQSKASGHSLRMLLGNRSSPQLATPGKDKERERDGGSVKGGFDRFDRRIPFTNVLPPPLPQQQQQQQQSSKSGFLFGMLSKATRGGGESTRITESMFERLKQKSPTPSQNNEERRPRSSSAKASAAAAPRTSLGGHSLQSWRDEQNLQDTHSRRLDGMLIEHMERERDILRRITTTLSKP